MDSNTCSTLIDPFTTTRVEQTICLYIGDPALLSHKDLELMQTFRTRSGTWTAGCQGRPAPRVFVEFRVSLYFSKYPPRSYRSRDRKESDCSLDSFLFFLMPCGGFLEKAYLLLFLLWYFFNDMPQLHQDMKSDGIWNVLPILPCFVWR